MAHVLRLLPRFRLLPHLVSPLAPRTFSRLSPVRLPPHTPWSVLKPNFHLPQKRFLRYHSPPPPKSSSKFLAFLDHIPGKVIFYGIIGLNGLVFTMWFMSIQNYKVNHDRSSLTWMLQNFTNSIENLKAGRIWTLLTCCFSHNDLGHILMNTFTFYFMAQPVLGMLGGRQFIFLYLGGGLASAASSMAYARFVDHQDRPSHGASGAIFSIVTLLACVAPTMTFRLYGIVPIPAWLVVSGLFAYDTYSTLADKRGRTDTVGHIGGVLAGVAYFVAHRFGRF